MFLDIEAFRDDVVCITLKEGKIFRCPSCVSGSLYIDPSEYQEVSSLFNRLSLCILVVVPVSKRIIAMESQLL